MYHTIHPFKVCHSVGWLYYNICLFKEKMVKIYNIKFDILTTLKCVIQGVLCIDAVQPGALFPCPPFLKCMLICYNCFLLKIITFYFTKCYHIYNNFFDPDLASHKPRYFERLLSAGICWSGLRTQCFHCKWCQVSIPG